MRRFELFTEELWLY